MFRSLCLMAALTGGAVAFAPQTLPLTRVALKATVEADSMVESPAATPVDDHIATTPVAQGMPSPTFDPELVQRALLETRLKMETKQRSAAPVEVPKAFPDILPKVAVELPPTDLVKAELTRRSLLTYRLANAPVPKAFPGILPKVAVELPPTDLKKEEQTRRAILAWRLARAPVPKAFPDILPKLAIELPPTDLKKAEQTRRDMLETRFAMAAAAKARAEEEMLKSRIQPKPPAIQEKLAERYASIDCLEEKAFTILSDLGMVGN